MIIFLNLFSYPSSPKKAIIGTQSSSGSLNISSRCRWLLPGRRTPNPSLKTLTGDHLLTSLQIFYADLCPTLMLISVPFMATWINVDKISLAARALHLLINVVRMTELVVTAMMLPVCSGNPYAVTIWRASIGSIVTCEIIIMDNFVRESILMSSSLLHWKLLS